MIFLTVGSQLAFDRLTREVDKWAGCNKEIEIFAQIGLTDFKPANMKYSTTLEPDEYKNKLESADILISHAGMGTIITALENRIPILIMPRRASLLETRNDHQIPTTKYFKRYSLVESVDNETELAKMLDTMVNKTISDYDESQTMEVSQELINKIQNFL